MAACVLAVALGACSTKATTTTHPQPSQPSPSPTALPDLWNVHTDARQGFSVAVPEAWQVVLRDSPSFNADVQAVSGQSPELGQYFTDSFSKHDQLRLLAADPRSLEAGFATNVNVIISDVGASANAPGLDDLTRAKVKLLNATSDLGKSLQQHRDHLSALDAVRLDYTLTAGGHSVQVRSLLATVERAGRRYLVELTMGALPASVDTLFAAEQRLFRLFTPAKGSASPSPSAGNGSGSSA